LTGSRIIIESQDEQYKLMIQTQIVCSVAFDMDILHINKQRKLRGSNYESE
jgi:hypothetical protein